MRSCFGILAVYLSYEYSKAVLGGVAVEKISVFIKGLAAIAATNCCMLTSLYLHGTAMKILAIAASVVYILVLCIYPCKSKEGGRLGRIHRGSFLMKIFLIAVTADIGLNVYFGLCGRGWKAVLINCVTAFVMLALMFMISAWRLYLSSVQLGIRWRALGAVFAFIPVINIIILVHMIRLADDEYTDEVARIALDKSRAADKICQTKYPILMVHGVFFRDVKLINYWNRIPAALEKNGSKIFYGKQQSADSVANIAAELKARIDEIVESEGCEKVNIIAHSKGGLDARMAASSCGCGSKIASITTIATPHHGSKTIDKLFAIPRPLWNIAAFAVNNWIRIVGDKKPDFLKLCEDFTTEKMRIFNNNNPDVPGVYYQSFACVMSHPFSDINLSTANVVIKHIEGPNDGLVSVDSAIWGETHAILRSNSFRGISHLDAIDLRRHCLTGKQGNGISDICKFYVDLVEDLRERGF